MDICHTWHFVNLQIYKILTQHYCSLHTTCISFSNRRNLFKTFNITPVVYTPTIYNMLIMYCIIKYKQHFRPDKPIYHFRWKEFSTIKYCFFKHWHVKSIFSLYFFIFFKFVPLWHFVQSTHSEIQDTYTNECSIKLPRGTHTLYCILIQHASYLETVSLVATDESIQRNEYTLWPITHSIKCKAM